MDDTLDWGDLCFLLELDRCGAATPAAKKLGTSHQTVTRRLRQLEQTLGIRLIDKSGTKWSLTTKGEAVCQMAKQMEEVANDIVRFSRSEPNKYSGRVGISSVSWAIDFIVVPALTVIKQRHPALTFELIDDDAPLDLASGAIDLALRFTNNVPPDLIGRNLGTLALGVFGTKSNIETLDRYESRLVTVVKWAGIHRAIWRSHVGRYAQTTKVHSLTTLLSALRHGLGVGVLPTIIGERFSELHMSQSISIDESRSAWILRNEDSRHSNKILAVEAEIGRIMSDVLKSTKAPPAV